MTSTTLVKSPESKNATGKKQKMSYLEALEIINKCDLALKEAAKQRVELPVQPHDAIWGWSFAKSFITGTGTAIAIATTHTISPVPENISFAMSLLSLLTLSTGGFTLASIKKTAFLVSPIKHRRARKAYNEGIKVHQHSEEEYAMIEAKVIKKAQAALKIVNKQLVLEAREMVYSNSLQKEGFEIRQISNLSPVEKEKLRIRSLEANIAERLELEASQKGDLKELTA